MTRSLVLVDTSALVEALREGGDAAVRERVRQLLAANQLAVWELVVAEVLFGTRDDAEYREVDGDLRTRHMLSPPDHAWLRAARLGYELRRQGHTVPLADLATAVVAMHNDVDLLHRDKHFSIIARVCDLREEYVGPPGLG